MSLSMLRLSLLPAVAAALSCDDGSCAANLLQVDTKKVRRGAGIVTPPPGVPAATEIKVIMAGFGRSGSTSAECALMHLGYNPNHGELIYRQRGALQKPWIDWAKGGSFEPALEQMLSLGYDATTSDQPTGASWREFVKRFPAAKVINLIHPHGVDGYVHDVSEFNFLACRLPVVKYFGDCCNMTNEMTNDARKDMCGSEYLKEHEEVIRVVPADKLLTYSATDGWDSLVKFLGVPVPSFPYPYVHGGQIEMCYPFNQPPTLWDAQVNGIDGALSPEVQQKGVELRKATRALTPLEVYLLSSLDATKAYEEEAVQRLANASSS